MLLDLGDFVYFSFEDQEDLQTQGDYGGIRLNYRGQLGEQPTPSNKAPLIQIDLGIGDPVTPGPVNKNTLSYDQESALSWQVYPPETIAAEKLHTVIVKGEANSRSRDIFELYLILPQCDPKTLLLAINNTFTYRGDRIPQNFSENLRSLNTKILQRGWQKSVGYLKEAPLLEEAFSGVINLLINLKI